MTQWPKDNGGHLFVVTVKWLTSGWWWWPCINVYNICIGRWLILLSGISKPASMYDLSHSLSLFRKCLKCNKGKQGRIQKRISRISISGVYIFQASFYGFLGFYNRGSFIWGVWTWKKTLNTPVLENHFGQCWFSVVRSEMPVISLSWRSPIWICVCIYKLHYIYT